MALPNLNHKNVVRYFGCWAERIDRVEDVIIEKRVMQIKRKLQMQQAKNKKQTKTIKEEKSPKKRVKLNQQPKNEEEEMINIGVNLESQLDDAFDQKKSTKSYDSEDCQIEDKSIEESPYMREEVDND